MVCPARTAVVSPNSSAQALNFVYILRTQGLHRGWHEPSDTSAPSLRFASSVQLITNGQTTAGVISHRSTTTCFY